MVSRPIGVPLRMLQPIRGHETILRRLDWQIWLIIANSENVWTDPLRRESFFGSFEGIGRIQNIKTAIRRRAGSGNSINHVIDVLEFDWCSIRKHSNIQVDLNQRKNDL